MPHPYVTKVTFFNNQLVLTIEIDEFAPGETLEISGHVTQTGGGFAVFNDIQPVPEHNPDGGAYMWVKAPPSSAFKKGHAVTVVLRAARVWATVLGENQPEPGEAESAPPSGAAQSPPSSDQAEPAGEGTTWGDVRQVAYPVPPPTGNGLAPPGSGASFHGGSI
jgi:hypothetical protein